MRAKTLAGLAAACCLLPAFLPEARAQSMDDGPFRICASEAAWDSVGKRYEKPEWWYYKECLNQVTRNWSPFGKDEIYEYMIAAEAADWGTREDGKPVSKECTLEAGLIESARQGVRGMLSNAYAGDLAMVPTPMASASWKDKWKGQKVDWRSSVGGQYANGQFVRDSQWVKEGQWPRPNTRTVAINSGLSSNEKWDYIVHEGMQLGRVEGGFAVAFLDQGDGRPLREAERGQGEEAEKKQAATCHHLDWQQRRQQRRRRRRRLHHLGH